MDDSEMTTFGMASQSVIYQDNNACEELSRIIMDVAKGDGQKHIEELEKNNELKIAYKKKESLPDEVVRESFIDKVKTTKNQYDSNINPQMFSKVNSNQLDNQDVLPVEDFSVIAASFLYEDIKDMVNPCLKGYKDEFNKIDCKHFQRENIYEGKGVETMVEETYGYDKYLKNKMINDICYLKRTMVCWRRVAGDGNCFYRSVIFSWLEYLVFNKKTDIFKIIISNLYSKFSPKYPRNKNLPTQIKQQFMTCEIFLVIAILEIIIEYLKEDRIPEAYLVLLKSFNATRYFDRIMIFYLRYLLFEFICDNKKKLYTKDFPVLLGNLLPQEYETEDGKFLYDEYFIRDLLKFYTCAEKLAVYLVPFVLKIDLNIVFYYYGNECVIENKRIKCFLEGKDPKKDVINVLYRKAHYDICYSEDYYNTYIKYLNIYSNLAMIKGQTYYFVDPELISKKQKELNENNPYNPEVSVIYNQILYEKKENEKKIEKEMEKQNQTKPEQKNIVFQGDYDQNIIIDGIKQKRSEKHCFICGQEVEKEVKKTSLSCQCDILLCSEQCKEKFNGSLISFFDSMDVNVNIECKTCGKRINRISLIDIMKNYDEESIIKSFRKKMEDFFGNYCMNCAHKLPLGKYKIIKCKAVQLNKILGRDKFDHIICENCTGVDNNCKICGIYHKRLAK